ncbi:hypothetical protein ACUN90_18095, partial [Escherichia sp. SP-MK2]
CTLTQLFYQGCGNFSHSKILGDVICLHMAPFFTFISVRFNAGQITSPRILEWLKLPHPW